jgi:two-component system response regulator YesN
MYKVFLADDEIVIREGIRNGFPWDDSQFILCGEAPDGEIAIPMIQELKPDILVTDIRMPFMDGLELARRVSRDMPWVHIVILSGYDEFSYAKEAISLGVNEYMLKPVSAQELDEVLSRIAKKIHQERTLQADLDILRQQLANATVFEREQLLCHILEGADTSAKLKQAEKLGICLDAPLLLVMLLEDAPAERLLVLHGILKRLANGLHGRAYQTLSKDKLILIVLGEDIKDIEERAYGLAQALAHEAVQYHLEAPIVAIGEAVTGIEQLPYALSSAKAVLRSIHGQSRRIVGSADMSMPGEIVDSDVLPLYEKLRHAALRDAEQIVEEYFASMGNRTSQSVLFMHYVLVDALLTATRIIKQHGGDPAKALPNELQQEGTLLQLSRDPRHALAAGKQMIYIALSVRDQSTFSRYSDILRKARAYIDDHSHRPEMTLSDVARHVSLSNNHFCTIFSQEMGQTFIEYLTQLRMDKSKVLLKTSKMRSSDIALEVGYNDAHYFSYLFKKNVGISPREFIREMSQSNHR